VSIWAWQLSPGPDHAIRLIRAAHLLRLAAPGPTGVLLLNEFGDFPHDATHAAGHLTPRSETHTTDGAVPGNVGLQ
jgi:hypothetical protein